MSRIKDSLTSVELGDTLDVDRIYQYGIYNPTFSDGDDLSGDKTFESLNGELTKSNFSTAGNTLTSECFKVGTFARGYFYGFDFPDRYHEAQFDQDPVKLQNDDNKTPKRYFVGSYSLSANIFVPYPSIAYISYQGFFCGEALKKDADVREGLDSVHKYKGNRFVHHLYVDDKKMPSMVCSAPSSVKYSADADLQKGPVEYRWRWQNRTKCVWLDKGYHKVELFVEGLLPIFSGLLPNRDQFSGNKLQHRCGSISILSIKAPNYSSTGGTPSWWWLSIENGGEPTLEYDNDGISINVPPAVLDLNENDLSIADTSAVPNVLFGEGGVSDSADSPWPPDASLFDDPSSPDSVAPADIELSFDPD